MEKFQYRHGGECRGKQIRLDFSVNTNPLGLPFFVRKKLEQPEVIRAFSCYPDSDSSRLCALIAKKEGVKEKQVICGNGASELLYGLAGAFRGKRGLLVSPCFVEYEAALLAGGVEVLWYDRKRAAGFTIGEDFFRTLLQEKPELLILCNPGNPMGELLPPDFLERALWTVLSYGGSLVVDECFLTLTGREKELSMAGRAGMQKGLFVLKAFTKTYAMAGLRLGYLVGNDSALSDIRKKLPDWNVSLPAQIAGECVLTDQEAEKLYIEETLSLLHEERRFLKQRLSELSLHAADGQANYLFFQADPELYGKMLQQGILIRQCGNYRGLCRSDYRIAVRSHAENRQLLDALKKCLSGQRQT